jgi:hypothetical protein
MVNVDFSEEQFRSYLNSELVSNHQIFIPTQPAESTMAVDAIMNSQNHTFWNMWEQIIHGTVVTENLWDGTSEPNPHHLDFNISFRANLFIQHKRPEYLFRRDSKEYNNWNQNYFRYKLDLDQQSDLSRLESNVSHNDALVIYACPACPTFAELHSSAMSQRIVENSNFVKASDLDNHSRYTFISGGTEGLAFSEPSKIKSLELKKELSELSGEEHKDNFQFISSLSENITSVIENSDEVFQHSYRSVLNSFEKTDEETKNMKDKKTKEFIHKIYAYLFVSNIQWRILYDRV